MDLLKGHRQPVMHLRKCKLKEIEALSVEEQGHRLPVILVDGPKALRVEEEEEPPVKTMNIEDMQEASNLVAQLKEQNLFKGEVQVPRFLGMEDSEAVESLENFIFNGDTLNADEKHEIMDPFVFNFEYFEDMELFFQKIENTTIKVHCGLLKHLK
nr:uncharacterized protein LOC129450906 isoform X2 [Misgurnus anguillicaudatus]XP_055069930.1 uncharacterized protein LOC129450906 isoform X2 [Misgurnus anguillicaudatus]